MLKKMGRDVAIYGSADLVFRVVGFFVFPVYAHVFSVGEFGIYALVTTTVGIAALLANLGLYNATQRYYWDPETEPRMQPAIVSTGLGVLMAWSSGVVILLIAGLYPVSEIIVTRYGISWSIMLIALLTIIPEQILQYCVDILRLHFSPWKFAIVSFLKNLLGVAVGLVLILSFDRGLEGLFFGGLVGALAAVPIALVLIRKDLTFAVDPKTAWRLVLFGYPFVFAGMAYWVFGSVDRWMLAEFSDTTQLGLYAIGYKFAASVLLLNGAFGQAWSPIALKLKRDDSQYRSMYARIFSVWFFLLAVVGSTISLFGKEVLGLLTPSEYWGASPILGMLVAGVVLSGTTQITAIGISLEEKTKLFASAAWTTALVNIVLNFLLIPYWGARGAALATCLSYGVLTLLYLFWSQRLHPIPLEKPKLIYSAIVTVSVAGVSIGMAEADASVYVTLCKMALLTLMVAGGFVLGIVNVSALKGALRGRFQV
ncbi:hypothetical protein AYO43_02845 [Nitrospira sp. SCGC AG-212-E16]|nr:hypothetical protein AYO43_02845 [Nitrospira sp. SCGC AG-212-E16]